jgi:hypothetical protein
MNNLNRREIVKLAAAGGAAALAGPLAQAADPQAKQPEGAPERVPRPKANADLAKTPKGNAEPVKESTATAEHYGPRELFAVVDFEGNLKRGMHAVSSQRLDLGLYEVIFNRDVRRGVYLVSPGGHGYTGIPLPAVASAIGRATDPRGVLVYMCGLQGDPLACGFHLLVVCPEGFA